MTAQSHFYDLGTPLEQTLSKVLLYPIAAFIFPFAPRYGAHVFRQVGMITVRTPENAAFFAANRRYSDADRQRVTALVEDLGRRVEADDWAGLADVIAELDRSRAALENDNARLSDIALDYLRQTLGEVVGGPNMCNFDYYFLVPDAMLARIEAGSRAHPDHPHLTALLAQVHIDRGWCARGGGWSHEVTEEGWEGLMNSFRTAHNLLQRFDVSDLRSPFYARVKFQLLATADAGSGLEAAREAYQDWSDLDVGNPLPHRTYAFFALPRWFGSWPMFEEEARLAAERTRHSLGKGAYALFYLQAFDYDESDALHNLHVATFREAVEDLVRRDADPVGRALRTALTLSEIVEPEPVTLIGELMDLVANRKRDALKPMIRELLENHVTHLPTEEGSDAEARALDMISIAFQAELKSGLRLSFTPEGLRAVAPPA